jgi:hypothetical protein
MYLNVSLQIANKLGNLKKIPLIYIEIENQNG